MYRFARRLVVITVLFVSVLALSSVTDTFAQGLNQFFDRWTGPVNCNIKTRGGKVVNLTYHKCRYWAQGPAVVRQDECWFFPNEPNPAHGITATCNHWVYWVRLDAKGGPTVWARCPTPMHPEYRALQRLHDGLDLWQVIPPADRAPGKTLHDLEDKFGATFATKVTNQQPEIKPGSGQAIDCIDFRRPVFASHHRPEFSQAYGPVTEAHAPDDYVDDQGKSHPLKYLQCEYIALDATGKVLRRDRCTYFRDAPVDPSEKAAKVSHYWIYWERVDGAAPVVWARCPTPNHPGFRTERKPTENWQHVLKKVPSAKIADCDFDVTTKEQPKIDNVTPNIPEIQSVDFTKTFSR